jgi:hypothetical protein
MNAKPNRSLTQRDLSSRQIAARETLYSDFIKEAFRLYAISATHTLEDRRWVVPVTTMEVPLHATHGGSKKTLNLVMCFSRRSSKLFSVSQQERWLARVHESMGITDGGKQ